MQQPVPERRNCGVAVKRKAGRDGAGRFGGLLLAELHKLKRIFEISCVFKEFDASIRTR